MFDTLFNQYMEDHSGEIFKAANEAASELEATIRERFTLEEYVELFEGAIQKYGYENERAAFCMGLSKGLCMMGAAAAISRQIEW